MPAFAQVTGGFTTRMTVQASCTAVTCNASSPTWCVTSPLNGSVYICDVVTGTYITTGTPLIRFDALRQLTLVMSPAGTDQLVVGPGFLGLPFCSTSGPLLANRAAGSECYSRQLGRKARKDGDGTWLD